MTHLYPLRPDQPDQWLKVLDRSFQYDFYHLPSYHALAEERGEGEAHLFVYTEERYILAIPLLLRPIGAVPELAGVGQGWWDATSVYGYAGPVASHADMPLDVVRRFQTALHECLHQRSVVTAFSRLHPLISQSGLLSGMGVCRPVSQTVSIDLTSPIDVQRAQYRKNHKHGINKLQRMGLICLHDQNCLHLHEFVDIYYETMQRVNASTQYFFERTYFDQLMAALEPQMHLFVCRLKDKIICGGLFSICNGIVQYHLGGTLNEYYDLAPTKLLFDTVRLWANERNAHVFHLGGGVDAQQDALFHFKAGFSDRVHTFEIWNWVTLSDIYRELCNQKEIWNRRHELKSVSSAYFPAYRCPSVAIEAH